MLDLYVVLMVLIEPLCFMLKRAVHIFLLFFHHKLSARAIENNISCGLSSSVAFAYKVQKLYALFMLKLDLSRFFPLTLPGTLFFSFGCNRNKYRCIVADCKATCFFPSLTHTLLPPLVFIRCKSLLCKLDLFATNIGTISSTFWFLSIKIRFLSYFCFWFGKISCLCHHLRDSRWFWFCS